MNSTRIRYNKIGDVLVSTKSFLIRNELVKLHIIKPNLIALLREDQTIVISQTVHSPLVSINYLKTQAKKILKECGVQFKDEVRVRKPKSE